MLLSCPIGKSINLFHMLLTTGGSVATKTDQKVGTSRSRVSVIVERSLDESDHP